MNQIRRTPLLITRAWILTVDSLSRANTLTPVGRNTTKRAPNRTEDEYSFSSQEAARVARVGYDTFNRWWDPTRRGWHIPVGDTTAFIPSIGQSRRRVPKARLYEIVAQGRTGEAAS